MTLVTFHLSYFWLPLELSYFFSSIIFPFHSVHVVNALNGWCWQNWLRGYLDFVVFTKTLKIRGFASGYYNFVHLNLSVDTKIIKNIISNCERREKVNEKSVLPLVSPPIKSGWGTRIRCSRQALPLLLKRCHQSIPSKNHPTSMIEWLASLLTSILALVILSMAIWREEEKQEMTMIRGR